MARGDALEAKRWPPPIGEEWALNSSDDFDEPRQVGPEAVREANNIGEEVQSDYQRS